jgi:hypothetical protein
MQILNKFMSMGSPHQWIDYLMPEDCGHYKLGPSSSIDDMILPDSMNFDQLMVEARAVLSRYLYVLVGKKKKKKKLIMFQAQKIIITFTHGIHTRVEN